MYVYIHHCKIRKDRIQDNDVRISGPHELPGPFTPPFEDAEDCISCCYAGKLEPGAMYAFADVFGRPLRDSLPPAPLARAPFWILRKDVCCQNTQRSNSHLYIDLNFRYVRCWLHLQHLPQRLCRHPAAESFALQDEHGLIRVPWCLLHAFDAQHRAQQ